jgi:hypothetical protein
MTNFDDLIVGLQTLGEPLDEARQLGCFLDQPSLLVYIYPSYGAVRARQ